MVKDRDMAQGDEVISAQRQQLSTTPIAPGAPTIASQQPTSANDPDALRALRERYQALVLATGQITWIARGEGSVVEADEGRDWRLYTGQSGDASHAEGWQEAIHPDDRARVAAAWALAGATRSAYEIEYRVRRFDGEYRWLLARGVPTLEADGSAREWVGTATDITERKAIEDALRANEEQLADELADMRELQRISGQLIREGNLDALYAQLVEAAIAVMRSDAGSMQMLDPERNALRLLAWRGFVPEAAAHWEWVSVASGTSCGAALNCGARVIVPDVAVDGAVSDARDLACYLLCGVVTVQSTPLISRDGRLVGMISTHWRTRHELTEQIGRAHV